MACGRTIREPKGHRHTIPKKVQKTCNVVGKAREEEGRGKKEQKWRGEERREGKRKEEKRRGWKRRGVERRNNSEDKEEKGRERVGRAFSQLR